MKKKFWDHAGSTLDSFLEEEGIKREVTIAAFKRVKAWQRKRKERRATSDALEIIHR